MKVQWQLVDVETKKTLVAVGDYFEVVDFLKEHLKGGESISWTEAFFLFGDPTAASIPTGIINLKS